MVISSSGLENTFLMNSTSSLVIELGAILETIDSRLEKSLPSLVTRPFRARKSITGEFIAVAVEAAIERALLISSLKPCSNLSNLLSISSNLCSIPLNLSSTPPKSL